MGGHVLAEDFDAFVRREEPSMLRMAYLMLHSQEDAKDVVQGAFEQVWKRRAKVNNPGAYLRTCVFNASTRTRRALQRVVLRETLPDETTEQPVDHVLDALQALRPQQRAIVVLRFYEQRSQQEIADILGVRLGTVKSGLNRGLAHLRERLGSEWGLSDE